MITFKKSIVAVMMVIVMAFAGNAVACDGKASLTGIEVGGGALAGIENTWGSSTTFGYTSTDNCFSDGGAFTISKHNFAGIGGSGTTGFMNGTTQASVYGAALGYKAVPETNPFIHCLILRSPEIPAKHG